MTESEWIEQTYAAIQQLAIKAAGVKSGDVVNMPAADYQRFCEGLLARVKNQLLKPRVPHSYDSGVISVVLINLPR